MMASVLDRAWSELKVMLVVEPIDAASIRTMLTKRILAAVGKGVRDPERLRLIALCAIEASISVSGAELAARPKCVRRRTVSGSSRRARLQGTVQWCLDHSMAECISVKTTYDFPCRPWGPIETMRSVAGNQSSSG